MVNSQGGGDHISIVPLEIVPEIGGDFLDFWWVFWAHSRCAYNYGHLQSSFY
jgi:hypothetical protein